MAAYGFGGGRRRRAFPRAVAGVPLPALPGAPMAAHGLRRLVSGHAGPAVCVRNAGTGAEQDLALAIDGTLDTAALSGSTTWTVTTLYDQTGAGRHLVQPTAANQPVLSLAGGRAEIQLTGASQALLVPAGIAFDRADHGAFFVGRQVKSRSATQWLAMGSAPDLRYLDFSSAFTMQAYGAGTVNTAPSHASLAGAARSVVSMVSRGGGLTTARDEDAATSATSLGALALAAGGQIGGGYADGNLCLEAIAFYAGAPDAASAAAIRAALRTMFATRTATTASVYFLGDSITNNVGGLPGFPIARLVADAAGDTGLLTYNAGTNGAQVAANTRPSWPVPSAARRVLHLWLGTNNIINGASAGDTIGLLEAAADWARASGGFTHVVCGTALPRSANFTDAMEAQRLALNAAIRASARWEAVADYAADPVYGTAGASVGDPARASNIAALYRDGTHPGTAAEGHAFMAPIALAAINAALAKAGSGGGTSTTPAPTWSVQPSISGPAQVGQTLTGSDGTIANGSVSGRQWTRDASIITGASGQTYQPVSDDVGHQLAFSVTASGTGGSATATSAATAAVIAAATPTPTPTPSPTPTPTSSGLLLDTLAASASGAWSTRRLRSGYAGPAIRVRRASDGTSADIGFGSGGDLDSAALAAFVGSSQGFVDTLYDQSGAGNHLSQATAASQPLATTSAGATYAVNGHPALFFNGAPFLAGSLSAAAATRTIAAVLSHRTNSTGTILGSSVNGGREVRFTATHTLQMLAQGAAASTAVTSAAAATVLVPATLLIADASGGYAYRINGADAGSGATAAAYGGGTVQLGKGASLLNGYVGEVLLFDSAALSNADREAVQASQKAWWGTA